MHTDLSEKIHTKSTQGASYYCVLVNDASGYKFVCLLRNKNNFIKSIDDIFTSLGRYPKVLRMDNTGEMTGQGALDWYVKHKIAVEKCSPREHYQNPRAESAVGTIGMRARTLLVHANAPKRYWWFAVHYACELENSACGLEQCLWPRQHRLWAGKQRLWARKQCLWARKQGLWPRNSACGLENSACGLENSS